MRKGCSIAVITLILLLIGLYAVIRLLINHSLKVKFGPERCAAQERYLREPWDFPEEWLHIAKPSKEYTRLREETIRKIGELHSSDFDADPYLEKIFAGNQWSSSEKRKITIKLNEVSPLLEILIQQTKHPEFDLETCLPPGRDKLTPDYPAMHANAKLLCLQAQVYAQQQEWQKAYEANLAAHRMAKRHPASMLICSLLAIAIQGVAAESMDTITAHCDDPAAMRSALNNLTALGPFVNLRNLSEAVKIDVISMLRSAKREGYEVVISPGQPGKIYFKQFIAYLAQKEEDEAVEESEQSASQIPQLNTMPRGYNLARMFGFEQQVLIVLSALSTPNFMNAQIREHTAIAQFDLNRINLAMRIEELKTGQRPDNLAAIIPKYIPKSLRDPHTPAEQKAPYKFDTAQGVFYSIGPDGVDNQCKVQYDSSNGIQSAGDIAPPASFR